MCRHLRGRARSYMGSTPRFAAANHIRGSRLAGEGVVSVDNDGGCAGVFAGKRAPTKGSTPRFAAATTSVGAGLLAKALCLAITMVDVPASSRASALLQRIRRTYHLRRTQFRRSQLAGEGVVSGDNDGGCAGLFAGKRAPTRDLLLPSLAANTRSVHKSASLKCRTASGCVMPSLIGQQRLNL